MSTSSLPHAPPLPTKLEDWQRQLKSERTLNDLVEDIHRLLCDDSKYVAYLTAIYDEQAVEGSLAADNVMAATMIRNKAKAQETEVASEKLATISKSLGVVLQRYKASRKQRRNMVAGEMVPTEDNND